jgi:hypothetical protein
MTYTVVRLDSAEAQLTEHWLAATDREAITWAAGEIESRLRTLPLDIGVARPAAMRLLVVEPLAAYYRVSEADRIVQVLAIWRRIARR